MGSHVLQHLDRGVPALLSAAESPGGLGSPHRPVQHNPGSGGEAVALGPPGDNLPAGKTRAVSSARLLAGFPAACRAPQAADSKKMAAASAETGVREGEQDSPKPKTVPDSRHRRQYSPLLVCRGPLFLSGPYGSDKIPFRPRMEADEHEKWFRKPPPPSLKSS